MSNSKTTHNKKLKRIISTFLTFISSTLLCVFFLLTMIIVHLISNVHLLVAFVLQIIIPILIFTLAGRFRNMHSPFEGVIRDGQINTCFLISGIGLFFIYLILLNGYPEELTTIMCTNAAFLLGIYISPNLFLKKRKDIIKKIIENFDLDWRTLIPSLSTNITAIVAFKLKWKAIQWIILMMFVEIMLMFLFLQLEKSIIGKRKKHAPTV